MIGIILAAGSGRRLKINKPKGMLNIGNRPLIQYSIDSLKRVGINQIIIVTGYKSEFYENHFRSHPGITLVHNAEYEKCGSLWSLYVALNSLEKDEDVVILDSDIIYNYDEFADFIKNKDVNAILATNVSDERNDACYIDFSEFDDLIRVSKNINYVTNREVQWEYIGITKSSESTVQQIKEYAQNLFNTSGSIDHEYDYAFESINETYKVCRYVDYIWSEADDNQQLKHLVTAIYPKLNLYIYKTPQW